MSPEQRINAVPRLPQSQAPLDEQLRVLHAIANRVGLYDAADQLQRSNKGAFA